MHSRFTQRTNLLSLALLVCSVVLGIAAVLTVGQDTAAAQTSWEVAATNSGGALCPDASTNQFDSDSATDELVYTVPSYPDAPDKVRVTYDTDTHIGPCPTGPSGCPVAAASANVSVTSLNGDTLSSSATTNSDPALQTVTYENPTPGQQIVVDNADASCQTYGDRSAESSWYVRVDTKDDPAPPPPSNNAPDADNDGYDSAGNLDPIAVENSSRNIGVLANDSDPDGDPLTITDVQFAPGQDPDGDPQGSAFIDGDTILYTPSYSSGTDVFEYTVTDGQGGYSSAFMAVQIVEETGTMTVRMQDSSGVAVGGGTIGYEYALGADVEQRDDSVDVPSDGRQITVALKEDAKLAELVLSQINPPEGYRKSDPLNNPGEEQTIIKTTQIGNDFTGQANTAMLGADFTISASDPQCSDGVDNGDSEDTLADEDDPGCHTDGDASNASSYSASDDNEYNSTTGGGGGTTDEGWGYASCHYCHTGDAYTYIEEWHDGVYQNDYLYAGNSSECTETLEESTLWCYEEQSDQTKPNLAEPGRYCETGGTESDCWPDTDWPTVSGGGGGGTQTCDSYTYSGGYDPSQPAGQECPVGTTEETYGYPTCEKTCVRSAG